MCIIQFLIRVLKEQCNILFGGVRVCQLYTIIHNNILMRVLCVCWSGYTYSTENVYLCIHNNKTKSVEQWHNTKLQDIQCH